MINKTMNKKQLRFLSYPLKYMKKQKLNKKLSITNKNKFKKILYKLILYKISNFIARLDAMNTLDRTLMIDIINIQIAFFR